MGHHARVSNNIAWVHSIIRIKDGFDVTERLNKLRPIELMHHGRPNATIAVLAADGSAVSPNQFGGFVRKVY